MKSRQIEPMKDVEPMRNDVKPMKDDAEPMGDVRYQRKRKPFIEPMKKDVLPMNHQEQRGNRPSKRRQVGHELMRLARKMQAEFSPAQQKEIYQDVLRNAEQSMRAVVSLEKAIDSLHSAIPPMAKDEFADILFGVVDGMQGKLNDIRENVKTVRDATKRHLRRL